MVRPSQTSVKVSYPAPSVLTGEHDGQHTVRERRIGWVFRALAAGRIITIDLEEHLLPADLKHPKIMLSPGIIVFTEGIEVSDGRGDLLDKGLAIGAHSLRDQDCAVALSLCAEHVVQLAHTLVLGLFSPRPDQGCWAVAGVTARGIKDRFDLPQPTGGVKAGEGVFDDPF
jgi:hypothetical protein